MKTWNLDIQRKRLLLKQWNHKTKKKKNTTKPISHDGLLVVTTTHCKWQASGTNHCWKQDSRLRPPPSFLFPPSRRQTETPRTHTHTCNLHSSLCLTFQGDPNKHPLPLQNCSVWMRLVYPPGGTVTKENINFKFECSHSCWVACDCHARSFIVRGF